MIPTRFEYLAPATPAACAAALGESSRVLAGGTWVLPEMGRGESHPRRLVDLRNAGLDEITVARPCVRLGAMCTYADVLSSEVIALHVPVLRLMAEGITGGWALRSQATLGGSAAAARPQSDVPATLVAARAQALVLGRGGERRMPVTELFAGAMTNGLAPDELLVGFEIPSARAAGHGYVKVKRGGSSWPIATAAATLVLDADQVCRAVSLALGGVSATPVQVDLSPLLVGQLVTDDLLRDAQEAARAAVAEPWGDVLAPADYRAAVAGPVARRSLTMARHHAASAPTKEHAHD